mmetsp:Transcript_27721/g.51210  ORF Transcript_27721/g.51210 Transcript_27721/m.51210 type:complete len:913 (-) Transcript_27721:139-2877(-)
MARISSSGSSYSASSSMSSSPKLRAGLNNSGEKDDLLNAQQSLAHALFGLLFSIFKERNSGRTVWHWSLLSVVLDFWQLFSTIVIPSYGWTINPLNKGWLYATMPNWEFIRVLSYTFYTAMLYCLIALIVIYIILGSYVTYTFNNQEFDKVLPSRILYFLSWLLFQCFDLACINLLKVGFDCRYSNAPKQVINHLTFFPSHACSETSHMINLVISVLFMVLFIILCTFYKVSQVEINPFTQSLSSLGHSGPLIVYYYIKILISLAPVFVNYRKIVALIYLALTWANFYIFLRYSPHVVSFMNYLRSGVCFSMFYISFLFVMLVFNHHEQWRECITWIMIGGFLPMASIGALISRFHLQRFFADIRRVFIDVDPTQSLRGVYDFVSPLDVEIASRIGRVWESKRVLDKESLSLAELVIKAGLAQFPSHSFLTIIYANLIIEGHNMLQPGQRQMQAAVKQDPSPMVRYMLYLREQLASLSIGNVKGGQLDLVSFADYQKKHRLVLQAHKNALMATSQFWTILQNHNVSFRMLSTSLSKIEGTVREAENAYHIVLEQYGNNVKLLRLYAKFLEGIKNDPSKAEMYYQEASKIEDLQGDSGDDHNHGHAMLLREGAAALVQENASKGNNFVMDERTSLTVLANSQGIIQMTSARIFAVLGYRKNELDGKNVACLMPQPWSGSHNMYVKKFVSTNEEKSHVKQQNLVAMHKDGYCFPVLLTFGKASGMGEDSILIGVLEPLRNRPGVSIVWSLPNGIIVGADASFSALSGCYHGEYVGSRLGSILFESAERIQQIALSGEDSDESGNFVHSLFDYFLANVPPPPPPGSLKGRSVNDFRAATANGTGGKSGNGSTAYTAPTPRHSTGVAAAAVAAAAAAAGTAASGGGTGSSVAAVPTSAAAAAAAGGGRIRYCPRIG